MQLREGQQVRVTAKLTTAAGHPAAYQEGTAEWESSDPEVISVEADPNDPLSATVTGLDGSDNGAAVVTFRADGDPDDDEVRVLVGTLDVVCTQGEATVVSLEAGTPVDIPAPATGEGEQP